MVHSERTATVSMTTAEKLADLRAKMAQSEDPGSERSKAKRAALETVPDDEAAPIGTAETIDAPSAVSTPSRLAVDDFDDQAT